MTIKPQYHQICSSIFIRDDVWLMYWPLKYINLSDVTNIHLNIFDFRMSGEAFFSLLQTFCDSASETIINALNNFNSMEFVNAQPLDRQEFELQTSILLEQFKNQVRYEYYNVICQI
jgi:hypothetical protein